MLGARENIEEHIREEYLLSEVHSAIEFTLQRMLAARDNIERSRQK